MAEQPERPAFPFAPKSAPAVPRQPLGGSDPTPMPVATPGDDEDIPGPCDPTIKSGEPPQKKPREVTRVPLRESQAAIPVSSPPPPEAPASPAARPIPEHLRQLGPYVIKDRLARGGMGMVFLGEDPALNRRVAIKVMAREVSADADALARFQREARATAAIEHPNVAMIYMVGAADDGSPFLAMEFVDGGTLEGRIRAREPLVISEAADQMIQVAEALGHAKKKGIIHRDIKPANVMMTAKGQVKVVDFGLAKIFHEDSFRTTAGTVMGTPRYMSPEQCQGREVDFRSDVYALGATFYHYLAGRAPYDGDSPTQIMLKHVTSPLVPIRSINPDVPMEFDDIIRKCMAKDPNDRYQDYADLVSDLSHVKLQWMARERGSIINSIHGLPGVGNDTFPPPPGASAVANRRPSSARQPVVLHEEHEEKVPLWRFALIAGAVLVIVGIGALMVFGPKKEQTSSPQSQATAATVAALLERFMAPPPASGGGPTPPPPHPDLVRYQYTRAILDDLGRGLATYYAAKGEYPPRLGVLIQEGYTVEPYVQSGNGTPIDGWDNLLLYSATSGTIRSGGMDGDMRTPDDLVVDPESGLLIEDIAAYEALE